MSQPFLQSAPSITDQLRSLPSNPAAFLALLSFIGGLIGGFFTAAFAEPFRQRLFRPYPRLVQERAGHSNIKPTMGVYGKMAGKMALAQEQEARLDDLAFKALPVPA